MRCVNMDEFSQSLEIIQDVLRDCGVDCFDCFNATFADARALSDDITIMEQMNEMLSVETEVIPESDLLNLTSLQMDNAVDENGNPLMCMWPATGDENCPEEVMLEIEVVSSMDGDEHGEKTFTDLDRISQSPEESSDYGSESGTDHTSDMDLSQGSLDLSRTGPYYRPPAITSAVTVVTPTEPRYNISPASGSPNKGLDLSKSACSTPNDSAYRHYSGGTLINLGQSYASDQNSALQLPRIKLEPGLHIDPTITYKPEMDFNHNQHTILSSSALPNHHPTYYREMHYEQNDNLGVKHEETMHNGCETMSPEIYEPRVTVETVNTNYIPLTVTSPDDDNDSGTESIDSKDSDACNNLSMNENGNNVKGDRKRPGRKKGQVSKVYHLWEFIRDVLNDPRYCGKVIKWENEEEGIFRVVQSEMAAAMWGQKKNNRTKMTYEKMSRSIRYSRKEGYFDDLPKDKGYPKKLCFKFGKKAHGWNKKKFPVLCDTNVHHSNEQRL